MRKLKIEIEDGKKYVSLDGRTYKFVEEFRGVREKFWLVISKSKFVKAPLRTSQILFKYNRNEVSCEDWGEVYASRVARQIGVPCVEYHLAQFEEDGKISNGVMCGTYKKNENEMETTVYDVQTIFGENVENINTVDDIIEKIMYLIPKDKDKDFYKEYLRNALLKQCIFDFVLAQTDRHWFNTTFLIYMVDDVFNIRKAECYDNGCIAYLKRKYSAIEGISREIKGQGKNSVRLHELLKDYTPMMGVKTSTVKLNKDRDQEEKKKLKVIKSKRKDFLDELVFEILTNTEIAKFYFDLKENLDVKLITDLLAREKTPPPKAIGDMVESVAGYQIGVLDNLIKEKIEEINASTWEI